MDSVQVAGGGYDQRPDDLPPPLPSPISKLPPELFSSFLHHIPPADLQSTCLALHRVFPDLGLANEFMWRHVVVRKSDQLMPLWRAAKARNIEDVKAHKALRSFAMESWRGDADILNNALRCLPDIETLILNMGTNFAPEHLEEMFEDPRPTLQRLELRFRPYVEQASYYQFLKGSYFDTAIESMTRHWPESPSFTHLSIVQDLPPRSTVPPTTTHSVVASTVASPTVSNLPSIAPTALPSAAQSKAPSVVTSQVNSPRTRPSTNLSQLADSIAELSLDSSSDTESSGRSTPPTSHSESAVEPKGYSGHGPFGYLGDKLAWARPRSFAQPIVFFDIKCIGRFGISPSARHLTHLRLRVPSRDIISVLIGPVNNRIPLFPSLRYLDVSTTNVRIDNNLSTLLRNYLNLEHLVLDRVNLFGFQAKDKGPDLCRDLASTILSAGLARGKERERMIAAWDVAERTRMAQAEATRNQPGPQNVSVSHVTPTEQEQQIQIARARRGQRSAAHSTFSLRDRPSRLSRTATPISSNVPLGPQNRLYLVLPPLPTLKTISIGGEAHHVPPARLRQWNDEFHSGWREGLGKLLGWAGHVGERYERAKKKADEWLTANSESSTKPSKSKGKGKALPTTRPPTDVRLYRFPSIGETPEEEDDPSEPTTGLIELHPDGKEYLDEYKLAIAEAELYANDRSYKPPCVLCTVPDCEGPSRRGDEGGRVDGRGGMEGQHVMGCGHQYGRDHWGWEGM